MQSREIPSFRRPEPQLIRCESVNHEKFYNLLENTIEYLKEIEDKASAENCYAVLDIDVDHVQICYYRDYRKILAKL